VRETRPPILFRGKGADGAEHDVALASAGAGLALVLVSGAAPVTETHLRALDTIGRAAGGCLARIGERDALTSERRELRVVADRLQGELREREDTLASTMHELRTPLTSVTAYGQLIAKNLQSALQQLAQLERLIGDLRHDPQALTMSDVDMLIAAREAAQRQRLLNDVAVAVTADGPGPFRVTGDAGRIGQVLDNLLGNAVKFSTKDAHVDIVVRRDNGNVILSVVDDGPGLASADLEHVFERYYRSGKTDPAAPGLGIGLAVSRDIVMAHGGRIWAESDGLGEGATFSLALPVASPARITAR
jgi:signal transduction histidine kinase